MGEESAAGMDFDYEIDRIYIGQIVHEWARNFRALFPDHYIYRLTIITFKEGTFDAETPRSPTRRLQSA